MTGDDDEARSLLGAYALDAVDADERAAVERLLAHDEQAAAQVDELRAVAARLGAAAAVPPPPALRADVLAAVAQAHAGAAAAGDAVPVGTAAAPPADHRAHRPSSVRWWALAAAFVVGAAVPGGLAVQQAQRAHQAEQQAAALAAMMADPSAVVVHGRVSGGGTAMAVFTSTGAAFSADGLPPAPGGHAYQLWTVVDGHATSAGMLGTGGAAMAMMDRAVTGSMAVTVEPAHGSTTPTTTPVVVLATT